MDYLQDLVDMYDRDRVRVLKQDDDTKYENLFSLYAIN